MSILSSDLERDVAHDASSALRGHPAWDRLRTAVEELRGWQLADGSLDLAAAGPDLPAATTAPLVLVERVVEGVEALAPGLPHDAEYLAAVVVDLRRWAAEGFGVPDFLDSLLAFRPELAREDGVEHLVVFPMYTQNGNPGRNLEAVLARVVWPDWVAELERTRYQNPMFVPTAFTDFTSGYDTHSAVLFPETVAVREVPRFTWGAIFCDREAKRFRTVIAAAVDALQLDLPAEAVRLLADQELTQETFVLWDLVHDRSHSRGDLPFDPFMIKQRMPYWMYALEELRCDLTALRAAVELDNDGVAGARLVTFAVVLDRALRFPASGTRVRNYDGLAGQLLFAYLRQGGAMRWTDSRLQVDWDCLPGVALELLAEIEELYWRSIDRPKVSHWIAGYELVRRFVEPHPASTWARGVDALPWQGETKELVDVVRPDEFPLSMFFETLSKKIGPAIESTRGIRA
jgi:Family of unknown function (DUF6421)